MSATIDSLGALGGQFWSTLIGAVVGAIVGGMISFGLQVHGVTATRNERLAARRQEDLAIAFSVIVKVIKVMSNIGHIKAALYDGLSKLNTPESSGAESWQVVPPFGTKFPEVTFTKEESAFVFSTKVKSLMLSTLELADVYNDLVQMVSVYSEKREALTGEFSVAAMEGSLAATDFDRETLRSLLPRMVPLKILIDAMAKRTVVDYDQARRTFDLLKTYCEDRFGEQFPKLELTDEANLNGREPNSEQARPNR